MPLAIAVLDESPVTASLHIECLDVELVPASPPLRDELRLCQRIPDALA